MNIGKVTINRPKPVPKIKVSDIDACGEYLLQDKHGKYNIALVAMSEVVYISENGYTAWSTKQELINDVTNGNEKLVEELRGSDKLSVLVTLNK